MPDHLHVLLLCTLQAIINVINRKNPMEVKKQKKIVFTRIQE
jgi:hypothetical protein